MRKVPRRPVETGLRKLVSAQLQQIAATKMADLNANTVDAAMRIIAGTARSMGIEVVDLSGVGQKGAIWHSTGKKCLKRDTKLERGKRYELREALQIVKDIAFAKFDESVEIAVCLRG